MGIWRLVKREILHRRLAFALAVLSVVIAVGVLVAELTLLRGHDLCTEQILAEKQSEAQAHLLKLEDDYRRIMLQLGFNILILPEGQQLDDFWDQGYATRTMPEEYVKKLADSRIMSIQHLLPILEQKVDWPEQNRKIILIGTRGGVPLMHRDPKKPILVAVAPGNIVLGYELWYSLNIEVGDTIRLHGQDFAVSKCHEERGSTDDITAWIDLSQAQELLDKKGRINVIQALKCHCEGIDLGSIREDISRILPGTQALELANEATVRARARDRARIQHEQAIAAEKAARLHLRRSREDFAAYLVPLVILGCCLWIGLLMLSNVRERRGEIGILRAIGLQSRQLFSIFLVKAVLVGLLGSCLGYFVGFMVGAAWANLRSSSVGLFSPSLFLLVLIASPLLCVLASLVPARIAAQQDPADVLREG